MFGFLKSFRLLKLQKAYQKKLEQAMLAQRADQIQVYADLTAEAELLEKEIEKFKQ